MLNNENPAAWQELLDDCFATHNPQGPLETSIVREMAFCRWRQQRAWFIENALNDLEMEEQSGTFTEDFDNSDEVVRQALAWKAMSDGSNVHSSLQRYEKSMRRGYETAAANLEKLRARAQNKKVQNDLPPGGGIESVPAQ